MSDAKEEYQATNVSNIEASNPANPPIISVPQPTEVAGTIDEQPSEEYVRVRGLITPKNSI
jgi:hypothetical protein